VVEVCACRDGHLRWFGQGAIGVCGPLGKGGCWAAVGMGEEGGGGRGLAAVIDRGDERGRQLAGIVSDGLVDRGGARGGGA